MLGSLLGISSIVLLTMLWVIRMHFHDVESYDVVDLFLLFGHAYIFYGIGLLVMFSMKDKSLGAVKLV